MKLSLIKTATGLFPADEDSKELYDKIKTGNTVTAEIRTVRNPAFMRKYFSLLKLGFDAWEPGEVDSVHGKPEKNFDRFRKDITILCGHYHLVVRLNGDVRVEADSIAFGNMTEETFEKLYNQTINVLLKNIYNSDMTSEKLDNLVNQYMAYV
ncbi:MAG: DUF1367 family protein [Deltaproteobacteria bacterium]|nr:DUF1367 family protein [Deltaproteobacteria bacterium]